MVVTCVGYLTYVVSFKWGDPKVGFYAFGIVVPFDIFVHWMFCSIYMKLSIEVRYLLDKRIYTDNLDIMKTFY